ncbi:MAG: thiolase family protein [Planctomycetota bacterium]
MRFDNVFIPYGAYWSTPFCKWQGSLATQNSLQLAAQCARTALQRLQISADSFDALMLGMTVPQHHSFYGAPWLAALIGAPEISGPTIAQACATGARVLATAAAEIESGGAQTLLTVTADRCSNGPHIYYPNPAGPGGTGEKEDWVFDNFSNDPWALNAMIETAEHVAREQKITRGEQDELTLLRFHQYQQALANDSAFLKRFMLLPLEVKDGRGKVVATVVGDEGVFATTSEGLAKLKPLQPDGTVTFGSQTHPADGNCGLIVCDRTRAQELARNRKIEVQVIAYGEARVEKGRMAKAPVPAARSALDRAGISITDCKVVKTHNPFAVNDVYFSRELGLPVESFNNYGSSLIFGHPQGPTGTRLVIETIEELAMKGGGYGLFAGCAAGDSGAAVVVKVNC